MTNFVSQFLTFPYFFIFGFSLGFFITAIYNLSKKIKKIILIYLINIVFWIIIFIIEVYMFFKLQISNIEIYYFSYILLGYITFTLLNNKKN